jgi:pilus assembly protein Flp/PilA
MPPYLRFRLATALSILLVLLFPVHGPGAGDAAHASTVAAQEAVPPPEGDATAIEYGLIAALVAVVIITGLTALGTQLDGEFDAVGDPVPSAGGGGGAPPCEGEVTLYSATHAPGDVTDSSADAAADFEDGGHVQILAAAASDFTAQSFSFDEQAAVVNAASATERPNVKLVHELDWTLTLLAAEPPGGPTGEMAQLRMDFDFTQLDWGIGGQVPQQDGIFEIEGPDGTTWGWSMEKNVQTGALEITSTNGPALEDFVFDEGTTPVTIQGIEFQPAEVLRGVGGGPSFSFGIPYGVATEVVFHIRRWSHTVVSDAAACVPALSRRSAVILVLLLLAAGAANGSAGVRRRRAA